MQRRNVGKTMCCLVAVLALVSSLGMFACSSDNPQTTNVSATVPANAGTIASVVGQPITIPNGAVFNAGIGANPVTLTFNTPSTFTLARTGTTQTASGPAVFGSCSFTVTASTFPAGQGPQVTTPPTVISFPTCNVTASATTVEVGGASVVGTLTLVLTNTAGVSTTSTAVTVTVLVNDAGQLFIVNPVTGATVDVNFNTNTGTGTAGAGR